MIDVLDETGVVIAVKEVLVVHSRSHEIDDFVGLIVLEQSFHLLEDELEISLDFQLRHVLGLGETNLVGVAAQVGEQALQVEELIHAEVHQFALHHGLHSLEQPVDPES